MFKSVLVANRGEIACRVFRTAKRMGIRTIAVYSEADAHALHVREADEAVLIGPAAARESYLDGAKVLAAARATGAEAIHPGYGFLSENAEFAEAVTAAGLIWIGPDPVIDPGHGSEGRGQGFDDPGPMWPVTPGYQGADQSEDTLTAEAARIGYPVLIKAVRRRRRQGDEAGRRPGRFRRRSGQRQARGSGGLWRRPGADRTLHHPPATHRGAGVRGQTRQCRPPVRARLLPATPPPEGDRGSPRAGHERRRTRRRDRGGDQGGQGR